MGVERGRKGQGQKGRRGGRGLQRKGERENPHLGYTEDVRDNHERRVRIWREHRTLKNISRLQNCGNGKAVTKHTNGRSTVCGRHEFSFGNTEREAFAHEI